MKLEEQLRTLRQEKGLSQTELAEMMDVSRQAVSRWETGAVVPSTENLMRLSKLYDVPLDEIVHGGIAVVEEERELPEQPETAEPSEQAERRPGGRKIAVWAAAVLCLLALAAGIWIGYIAAPEEEDNEIILMEDMKGEEVEREPENTFATESLEERR